MNDDVEDFYTNPIPNERRSRWLSWLKRGISGGAFWYRIGIAFVGIVDVLMFASSKLALALETSSKFHRSIFMNKDQIALPCQVFGKFRSSMNDDV